MMFLGFFSLYWISVHLGDSIFQGNYSKADVPFSTCVLCSRPQTGIGNSQERHFLQGFVISDNQAFFSHLSSSHSVLSEQLLHTSGDEDLPGQQLIIISVANDRECQAKNYKSIVGTSFCNQHVVDLGLLFLSCFGCSEEKYHTYLL